jgi:hypothetical protein
VTNDSQENGAEGNETDSEDKVGIKADEEAMAEEQENDQ